MNLDIRMTDRLVYAALVMDPKNKRTQAQAARAIGKPRSTVSGSTRRLLKNKYIARTGNSRCDIMYRKGRNSAIIENYIAADVENGKIGLDLVDKGCAPSKSRVVRTHLNGGWVSIKVMKRGVADRFDYRPDPLGSETITQTLFGNAEPKHLKGAETLSGKILFRDEWYGLQLFVRNRDGGCTLKVSPPSRLQSVE